MEEVCKAHMDTGVSSTTDDVLEVQEIAAPSAPPTQVETVVTVMEVDELSSPSKDKTNQANESLSENNVLPNSPEISPQKESQPIKKIIIKRPAKPIQIQKPQQKSPIKPEVFVITQNKTVQSPNKTVQSPNKTVQSPNKIVQSPNKTVQSPNKTVQSPNNTLVSADITDSAPKLVSSEAINSTPNLDSITPVKTGTQNSPSKDNEKVLVEAKEVLKSPTKNVETSTPKVSPPKALPLPKEPTLKVTTNKEQPTKIIIFKDKPPTPNKDDSNINSSEVTIMPENKQPPNSTSVPDTTPQATTKVPEKPAQCNVPKENENVNSVLPMEVDKEASNDSQIETNSDVSEKEHNKSISRELKSLIKSAKDSKIISECNQVTSKTRKSRTPLDTSLTNLNTSIDPEKIQGVRRSSDNSQISTSSDKSDKALKRSMRSQNPEFVSKVKNFLNSVTGKVQKDEDEVEEVEEPKAKTDVESASLPKKKKTEEEVQGKPTGKLKVDPYCWRCHYAVEPAPNEKAHNPMQCSVCPRSYHYKCLSGPERSKINVEKSWVCPECLSILQAENSETRSPAMKKISLGMLCDLLKHALDRMMDLNGVEPFMNPVDRTVFPDYDKYVVHAMDLTLMKQHIADRLYGSTEAFLSDAQWILHNSIIFNTLQSKLTGVARSLVRSCKAEMGEIEACPECYAAAHARRPTWFTDVCSTPHILLWAKLKGFPYWPAKGMTVNSSGLVDVRFFGAHDRAWVPARDCFLYSEKDPNNFRTKRQDILDSMQEAEQHIRNISRKYGKFVYPPFRIQFDPAKLNEQIKLMIPSFEGEVRSPVKDKTAHTSPGSVKTKSRSNSKSSKSSFHDGEGSETEGLEVTAPQTKISVESENVKEAESLIEKEKPEKEKSEKEKPKVIEVEVPAKEGEGSRKRRRSELEEAVITIMDTHPVKEKRRKIDENKTEEKKTEVIEIKDTVEENKANREKTSEKVKEVTKTQEKSKNAEPPPTPSDKGKKVKVISIAKVMKTAKPTPIKVNFFKNKDFNKSSPKQKAKSDKTGSEKDSPLDKKSQKRRNSRNNKSLNASVTETKSDNKADGSKDKSNIKDKNGTAKPTDKSSEKNTSVTEKSTSVTEKNTSAAEKNTSVTEKNTSVTEKNTSVTEKNASVTESPKSSRERIQFDDDTSLAVIARQTAKANSDPLPTITNVRSLSTQNESDKGSDKPAKATSDSSVFTPTSTENVRNMKEAVDKLQKLRNDTADPPVGRVGVRAFARMTSPPAPAAPENTSNNSVEVEIKAEPMDFDDPERHMEKMDLMNAFKLRPVNPTNLREVRINKVVVTPLSRMVTPNQPTKPVEVRPRAKKTFPQPKKADEGRSELNSKNSMVYIPIQPPMTQAPVRMQRPAVNGPTSNTSVSRTVTTVNTCTANNAVNTVTTPLIPPLSITNPTSTTPTIITPNSGALVPTVGQVPTTVHTVPLITTVNGQWTFSLQPIMSVGGGDGAPSPPIMNGLPERVPPPTLLPIAPAPNACAPAILSAAPTILPAVPPTLVTPIVAQPARNTSENNLPAELPRLQQRPALMNPLDSNTPVGNVPPPSSVGPLTAKLNQNAVKMTDFFRTLLEDCMEKLDDPVAQLTMLKLQLEQANWRYQQQIEEIKHNYELSMAEMRTSFEKEKTRLVSETRRAAQAELEAAVKAAKTKQWCANCSQEAQFYCCWNTSYCDYPCQRAHWSQHFAVCTQQRNQDDNDNPDRPPPDNLPKTTAAPSLIAGKQLAPSRVYAEQQQQQHVTQKPSIIVSMVEDKSGNQTMKCVGTYKPPASSQSSPRIINKQLDENSKKVVTSGGYLIVGASNSSSSTTTIVNPPRRSNTIQYIS